MIGYHFVGDTLRDGRPVPQDGEWLVHDGPIELCRSGLHWSKHPLDAIPYAPGNILCVVECEGETHEGSDKLVSRRRKIIKRVDATDLLRGFARWQAYQVLHLWDAPEVVRLYILTGDNSLRDAAWAAASAAARHTAWDAAMDAARNTANAAANAAASAAARDAAWHMERVAAWYTAWDAAMDAAMDDFLFLVELEFLKQ